MRKDTHAYTMLYSRESEAATRKRVRRAVVASVALSGILAFALGRAGSGPAPNLRNVTNACNIGWELCRQRAGSPVHHDGGRRWVEVHGTEMPDFDQFRFVDAAGKTTPYLQEDDATDDDDPCGVAWRACWDATTPQEGAP